MVVEVGWGEVGGGGGVVAGGRGEGEAGGGEVVGQGVVGGGEAVEGGRRGVDGGGGEVAGQEVAGEVGKASPPGRLAEEWVCRCSLPGLLATSGAANGGKLFWQVEQLFWQG